MLKKLSQCLFYGPAFKSLSYGHSLRVIKHCIKSVSVILNDDNEKEICRMWGSTAVLILFSIDVLPFKINPIKENARWTWFNYNGQKSNGDHGVNVILRLRGARQHWVIVVSKNTGAK